MRYFITSTSANNGDAFRLMYVPKITTLLKTIRFCKSGILVEITSLEQLEKLRKAIGLDLIIRDSLGNFKNPVIEIYDDYRE